MKASASLRLGLAATLMSLGVLAVPATAPAAPAPAVQAYARLHGNPVGSYTVDPDHSLAQFSVGHAGVAMLSGDFSKISGSYTFDPRHPKDCKADISIPVNTIATFLPMRDKDLLDTAFFDASKYPTMHFVSTRYVPHGLHHGVLLGELTLRGVTRPVRFRVHLLGAGKVGYLPKPWGGYLTGFVATTVIDRTAFGMDAYASGIGHKVRVRVEIEGVRKSS